MMGSIKNLFRKKSNASAPDPEASSQLSPPERASGNESQAVTDYRSFSEDRRNRSSPSRRVTLRQSDENLLEDQRNLNNNNYRGFSTSMHDMFTAPEFGMYL